MNILSSALEKLKYDIRMIDIHMKNSDMTKEEFEKYLKSLPDSAGNGKNLNFNHDGTPGKEEA